MSDAGETPKNPELERVAKEREIYDKAVALARSGKSVPIRNFSETIVHEGHQYTCTTQEAWQSESGQPRLFIERKYQDDDGLWWTDVAYRFDPYADELLYVHEQIIAKAHHIGDLNGMNPYDASFHGDQFITRSDSPYTFVRDYIREDQPLRDETELNFLKELISSAFQGKGLVLGD